MWQSHWIDQRPANTLLVLGRIPYLESGRNQRLELVIRKSLLAELSLEAENTRKLFRAIPDEVLTYKPNDFNWTIAQLASHIAEIYSWWDATLNLEKMEMTTYSYDKGDISTMASISAKLEVNIEAALKSLENYPEERLLETWSMEVNGRVVMPPTPRVQVIRSFLMNHLYHHRGELIAYLRANGLPVPGLYGPSYEEQQAALRDAGK